MEYVNINIESAVPKYKKKLNKVKKISKDVCFEWFEKYLFGDQFKKKEKNTIIEDNIWKTLSNFIDGNSTSKEGINNFKKLKQCKDVFKDYLTPKEKVLYRGFTINNSKLLKSTKNKPKKIITHKSAPKQGMYIFDYVYTPYKEVESWTTEESIAVRFAANFKGGKEKFVNLEKIVSEYYFETSAIIRTKTDDSFFGNPKLTNFIFKDVNELKHGKGESEIFRLGKKIKVELLIPKLLYDELMIPQTFI